MELGKMIILYEYPFSIVDHIRFTRFCGSIKPLFKVVSHNTMKSDIIKIYETKKSTTLKLLEKNSSRIAITIDLWTSTNQNKGYMSVTAHFINDTWTLQSRIVRFIYVPAPHTAEVLSNILVECLFDWNLDKKLLTLTVDNCSANNAVINRVFYKISASSFSLGGSLFHMRCCAHVLNLIVKKRLSSIDYSIQRIRESMVYWVATPKREEKFVDTCHQLNINYSKKLALDCRTRWNFAYLMLASASPYKDIFGRLRQREPQFKHSPNDKDWKMVTEISEKLEIFHSVTELFSGSHYPTANIKVCEIRLSLTEWFASFNCIIKAMAESMVIKFEKYWGVINGVMAIGVVLDPRYKMKLLNHFFPLMYPKNSADELQRVRKLCEDLVSEYQAKDKKSSASSFGSDTSLTLTEVISLTKKEEWKCSYFQYVKETSSGNNVKSELDLYLEESVLLDKSNEEEFDILDYWKQIGVKYPTLQRIARDFLAIPISTVGSESAFSTGDHFLSSHQSRLHVDTVESLMCCQDWLRNSMEGPSKVKAQYGTMIEDQDVDDAASHV